MVQLTTWLWSISYGTFRMEHFLNLRNKFANGLGCSTCFDEPIPVDCPSVELWTLSISFYKKIKMTDLCIGQTDFKMRPRIPRQGELILMPGQVSPPHMNAIVTKSDQNSELRPGSLYFRL